MDTKAQMRDSTTQRSTVESATQLLERVRTKSDRLSVGENGQLVVDGAAVTDIIETFGSPCYVVCEDTLRANYRRIRDAFEQAWPKQVSILFAIKANNNLAIRRILYQEGAGTDCFGEAEMYATFLAGSDPRKTALNGSNKSDEEVRRAVQLGVTINIDSEEEIEQVSRAARELGCIAPVSLRLKVVPEDLKDHESDYFGVAGEPLFQVVAREKWGFSVPAAAELVKRIKDTQNLELRGYHLHISRISRDPNLFRFFAASFVDAIARLRDETGFEPTIIDIGGGWSRTRDPESRNASLNPWSIEDYADAVCESLILGFEQNALPLPELWLEPGRYIVGNAEILLTTVGAIKHDLERTWVNVDASTNNLMRIDTSGSSYYILPATKMDVSFTDEALIVGPTCVQSILSPGQPIPVLERGDVLAILDTGMYAETVSTQFNGTPRPATVLVHDGKAELIKERESIADVFAKHRIPERLLISQA